MRYLLAMPVFFSLFLNGSLVAQIKESAVQLNQVGFYPAAPKIAVVTKSADSKQFYLLNQSMSDTVFAGTLSGKMQSANSSIITQIADFSSFKKPGTYVISIPGTGNSFPFRISKSVHREAAVAALKSYYFQRVSMPLEEAFAGKWKRAAGHPDTQVLIHPSAASQERPAGTVISTPGGWYDAGDYNKYIVNSGITMGTLLSAYEDLPSYFNEMKTNIPESGNAVPDILDELIVNLRWMLTMQDPADGGVYNKCTNANFDGMVMPGVTKLPRYVVQKGTAATLDFAAVTAQSSRILAKFNKELPGLSDSCLAAAKKAWQWAEHNPKLVYDQDAINKKDTPVITTGGYGDRNFNDEFFWAACELYSTTKDPIYLAQIQQHLIVPVRIPSWNNVHLQGVYSLLRIKRALPANLQPQLAALRERLISFADTLIASTHTNAFKTVMGRSRADFNWGSNSNAANQGIFLINAYLQTKQKKYLDAALTNVDYIHGRNATGFCFVTGIGTRYPLHPHHRISVADGIDEPVPGLLSGGPNPGKQDKCAYAFHEPETTFADVDCSYASNEIAINWNAPLVYLVNAIEALQQQAGFFSEITWLNKTPWSIIKLQHAHFTNEDI